MSNFDPHKVKLYRWGYSWGEIKKFYIQKQKEQTDRTNQFAEFLVELTQSVMKAFSEGSDNPDEIGIDNKEEGVDELTQEQMDNMIESLGLEGFYQVFPSLKPEE